MPKFVYLKIDCCKDCPMCDNERTPGAGYALDYFCKGLPDPNAVHGYHQLAGYVEHAKEEPQKGKIPDICPLIKRRKV